MERLCDSDGVEFLPERLAMFTKPGKKADVLVLGPDKSAIAVEAEYPPTKPDKDAEERFGLEILGDRGIINTAIGVIPPDDGRQIFGEEAHTAHLIENQAPIQYVVLSRNEDLSTTRWPAEGYITGTAESLTELAVHLLIPHEKVASQAERTAETMLGIADDLENALSGNNAALDEIAKVMGRPNGADSLNVVGVVWLNAFLFQDRIAEHHQSKVPFRAAANNGAGKPVPSRVIKAWNSVTDINYKSVYIPALESLRLVEASIGTSKTGGLLRRVSDMADEIQTSSLGVFDIGGELFPRLLSDRSESASYYTRPEVAEFLAHMTAFEGWLPPAGIPDTATYCEENSPLLIGDFACGTGTLLRAGYRRIRAKARRSGTTQRTMDDLHKYMMESGIAGFDISPIAAHLTASSLSNIQPNVDYKETNIGVASVCETTTEPVPPSSRRPKNHATTGSLELLRTESMGDLFAIHSAATAGDQNASSLRAGFKSFDLILMNPPYSRTRGGQALFDIAGATEENRKRAQKRIKALLKGSPANLQAGLATAFCDLANLKSKPGGRLGIVLPMTAASASSWAETRQMLEDEFDDLTLIAYALGAAGGVEAMSADTAMGEMLVIGTKRESKRPTNEPRPDIVTVTVAQSFTSVPQAVETARAISSQEFHSNSETENGVIYVGGDQAAQWIRTTSTDGAWTALGVVSFDLIALADRLTLHDEFCPLDESQPNSHIPMTTVGELFQVGPTHDRIGYPSGGDPRGAFEFHQLSAGSKRIKDLSLWAANSSTQTKITVKPTHYGTRAGTAEQANEMRNKASTLFYQRNIRWTSQKILAAVTDRSHMGSSAWTALLHDDEAVRFGFAIWANSSLGMLTHWSRSQRQQLGRSRVQIEGIQRMPCPDFEDSTLHSASRALLDEQPELLDLVLKPANKGDQDQARSQINAAAAKLLGIEEDALADIARVWCAEPTVRG